MLKQSLRAGDYPDLPSIRKPLQRQVARIVLTILGRSMASLSKVDPVIQAEVHTWPKNLILQMAILPDSGSMTVQGTPEGKIVYLGDQVPSDQAQIVVYIKTLPAAFKLLTGQIGTDQAYARHWIAARGDLSLTLSLTRILNRVETVLFPALIARRLMKRLPDMSFLEKWHYRLRAYLLGIPFGI